MTRQDATIDAGSEVRLHLSLSLADGTSVFSTFDEEPLHLVIGDGTLSAGLEKPLHGMQEGDEKIHLLAAGEAYGARDENNVHPVPRADFPPDMELTEGTVVGFAAPDGSEVAGAVVSLGSRSVEVDFNHPLAGRELFYRVRVLSIADRESKG